MYYTIYVKLVTLFFIKYNFFSKNATFYKIKLTNACIPYC